MKISYKRLLAAVMSILTAVSLAAPAMAADSAGKYGDVNVDGKVNSSDALLVLKHSVSTDASVIDRANWGWADVNGNGDINSTDALEILMVSVGKRAKFTVEITIPAPTTKQEMLDIYANAVAKARNDIPSYKLKISTSTKDADISGLLIDFIGKDAADEMKQSMITSDSYQNVFRKGADSSLSNLPTELAVKDASKYKNVTFKSLNDGNYQIVIEFKDEKNPKAGSVITKVLNLPDFDAVEKGFEEEMNSVGSQVPVTVDLERMEYKNCKITCVVDSTTGEIISLATTSDMAVSLNMNMGLPMNMKMTTVTLSEYSNFSY